MFREKWNQRNNVVALCGGQGRRSNKLAFSSSTMSSSSSSLSSLGQLNKKETSHSCATGTLTKILLLGTKNRYYEESKTTKSREEVVSMIQIDQIRHKKLTFSHRDDIHLIISRHDITPKELSDTWYSRSEYDAITQECSKQINTMEQCGGHHILQDQQHDFARGLESHTRTRSLARIMNRAMAYQAVLLEQNRQRHWHCGGGGRGVMDDIAIARAYNRISSSCQLWANVVGLSDQKKAQDIHDDLA